MNRVLVSEAKAAVIAHVNVLQEDELVEFISGVFGIDIGLTGFDEIEIEGDIYNQILFKSWLDDLMENLDTFQIINAYSYIEDGRYELDPEDVDYIIDYFSAGESTDFEDTYLDDEDDF